MDDYRIEEATFPRRAVLRKRMKDSLRAMGKLIGGLYGEAGARRLKPAGPVFAIYYEKPQDPESVDYEMCLPVEGDDEALENLDEIGGEACLRIVWRGSYKGLSGVYDALSARVQDGNLGLVAPPREVYVRGPLLGFIRVGLVTEVWFPIRA